MCLELRDFINSGNRCPLCTYAWRPKVAMVSDILAAFFIDLFESSKPSTPDGWFATDAQSQIFSFAPLYSPLSTSTHALRKGLSAQSLNQTPFGFSSHGRVLVQSFKVAHDCYSITDHKKVFKQGSRHPELEWRF